MQRFVLSIFCIYLFSCSEVSVSNDQPKSQSKSSDIRENMSSSSSSWEREDANLWETPGGSSSADFGFYDDAYLGGEAGGFADFGFYDDAYVDDSVDNCAINGWYNDGVCDDFCPLLDPDCSR